MSGKWEKTLICCERCGAGEALEVLITSNEDEEIAYAWGLFGPPVSYQPKPPENLPMKPLKLRCPKCGYETDLEIIAGKYWGYRPIPYKVKLTTTEKIALKKVYQFIKLTGEPVTSYRLASTWYKSTDLGLRKIANKYLSRLTKKGLLKRVKRGYYVLTAKGEKIAGKLI